MATIVRGRIPADEFALADTIAALPDVVFDCEQVVERGDGAEVPLLWARGVDDAERLTNALEEDASVENAAVLTDSGDECLCRLGWIEDVPVILHLLADSEAIVLDARSDGGPWDLRVLYPSRESLAETLSFCETEGLTFEVDSIRRIDRDTDGRFGLTDQQYEALMTAHDLGYYDVPRQATLQGVADHLDISHQALSERLRRGYDALIEATLVAGARAGEE